MLKNSIFILAGRVSARVLGLIGTLVVARLLDPKDYGIIAVCMIVQEFATRMQKIGLTQNIISKEDTNQDFLSTAFFTNLGMGLLASVGVFLVADQAAQFLETPQAGDVLKLICWSFVLNSLTNIGMTVQAKKENFAPEIYSLLASKVISVVVTIYLAIVLGDYWALAIGIVTSSFFYSLFSYIFARPFIPTIASLSSLAELFGFSKWIFLQQNVDFFNAKVVQISVAKLFDPTTLGYFSMGSNLTNIYAGEVTASVDKSNLSHVASQLNKGCEKKEIVVDSLKYVFDLKHVIILPLYLLAAAFPGIIIELVLGPQWLGMAPYLTAFLLSSIVVSYNQSFITLLFGVRIPKFAFYNSCLQVILRTGLVVLVCFISEPLLLAYGSLFVNIVGGFFLFIKLKSELDLYITQEYIIINFYQFIKTSVFLFVVMYFELGGWYSLLTGGVLFIVLFFVEMNYFKPKAYLDLYNGGKNILLGHR